MRKLSTMSLLYLYHMLLDDVMMDEDRVPARAVVIVSNAYSLSALRILDELFAERTLPWKRIMQLHSQYSTAALLEEQHHTKALEPYEPGDMLRILSGKSAMAKLILLSLCALANRDEYLEPLMKSFDLHYVADQMFDDFRDWKIDLGAGRYSCLLTRVITSCKLEEKVLAMDGSQRVELVGKYLYLSGVVESYLDEVLAYWDKAKKCVESIACPQWIAFINNCQMRIHGIRSELACGARRLLLQEGKYAYNLVPATRKEIDAGEIDIALSVSSPVPSVASSVSEAGQRAVDYLRKQYTPGVGFEDFVVFSTPLPVWVGAYAGVALAHWYKHEATSRGSGSRSLKALLMRLAGDLIDKQREDGWAPNSDAPSDADSTSWVLRFLMDVGAGSAQIVNRAIDSLLIYQRRDGGFRTIMPDWLGKGFASYGDSHVEVTAVAIEALLKVGLKKTDDVIEAAARHLKQRQAGDGLWQAYWWDGQMFATYHSLRSLLATGEPFEDNLRKDLAAGIIRRQSEAGTWGEETAGKNFAFETSLALRTLLQLQPDLAGSDAVKRGIVWLLKYQGADGSWDSRPMLRVPDGNDKDPWTTRNWKPDMANGVGILVRDQNRSFTTATVLGALTDFLACAGEGCLITTLKQKLQAVA